MIDRFVRGDDVPDDVLRQVWQNAAVTGTVWDVPIYEEFYRTVRAVNGSLPKARHCASCKRIALMPGSHGQMDRLKRYCAAVLQKQAFRAERQIIISQVL